MDAIPETRWDTAAPQIGGEVLSIDLGERREITGVILDTSGSPNDYPRRLRVEIGERPDHFREVLSLGPDRTAKAFLAVPFLRPISGRYLRFTQLDSAEGIYWSVHECVLQQRRLVRPIPWLRRWLEFGKRLGEPLLIGAAFVASLRSFSNGQVSPRSLMDVLCLWFAAAMFAAPWLPDESVWGFRWIGNFSPRAQVAAGAFLVVSLWPRVSTAAERAAARGGKLFSDRTLYGVVVITFAVASWLLRSATDYGDGVFTPMIIEGGFVMNWKEPLDRLITALTYRALHQWLGWDARSSIALVSCAAGVIYAFACILVARTLATSRRERFLAVLLLLVLGAAQLFFGNVENYSLLAAGTMFFLYTGLRYLRGCGGIAWPSAVIGLTAATHLSAVWLLPTIPLLSVLRRTAEGRRPLSVAFRVAGDGIVSAAVIGTLLGATFLLGLQLVPAHEPLSLATFGGGDQELWVPLRAMTSSNHKFTLFSGSHLLAIANEILLLCPIGLFLVSSHLPFVRRLTTDAIFLGVSTLLCFLYLLVFNPDLAIFNVGILNEWDLFSPVAFPLTTLGVALWLGSALDSSRRLHIAAVGLAFAAVHAASWILSNASVTF